MQRLLTTQEVADMFGCSTRHVSRLREHGLNAIHLGHVVRYRPEDLEAFIQRSVNTE